MKVDIDVIKRKFFASCNTIFSNCNGQTELVRLSLVESYCLPILQFAVQHKLSVVQTKELNACWNMVYRKFLASASQNQ